MGLAVDRVVLRYEVPRRLGLLPGAAALGPRVTATGPDLGLPAEVVRIKKLRLRLSVTPADLAAGRLRAAWERELVRAIHAALARAGTRGDAEVARAPSRAAWLARLLRQVASGRCHAWEFAGHEGALGLAAAPALVRLLLDSGHATAVEALLLLAGEGALDPLLRILPDEAARLRMLEALDAGATRPSLDALLAVGGALAAPGVLRTSRADEALRLFLRLAEAGEARRLGLTATGALHAVEAWRVLAGAERPRPAKAAATGTPSGLEAWLHVAAAAPATSRVARVLETLGPTLGAARECRSAVAGLFLLAGPLLREDWPGRLSSSPLAESWGSRLVAYVLAGVSLALLRRVDACLEGEGLDPAVALFAGWLQEPDVAGLRRFLGSCAPEDRRGILESLGAEASPAAARDWPSALEALADRLAALFAASVRGFRRSSRGFAVERFLAVPGRLRVDEAEVVAALDPSPLQVALLTSGLEETFERVAWLGGRRLVLRLGGPA